MVLVDFDGSLYGLIFFNFKNRYRQQAVDEAGFNVILLNVLT